MKVIWLEKWWGITVFGMPIRIWRDCSGCYYANDDMTVNMRETDIIVDLGLKHTDIDDVHYRWQIHNMPAVVAAA